MPDIPLPNTQRGRRARAPITLGLALLGVASALGCGGDAPGPIGPPTPQDPPGEQPPTPISTLTTLEVTPDSADLCVSGTTLQLMIVARDKTGAAIPGATATYSSSAPSIAAVSSRGVVTAGAPGRAVITATSTRNGVTRTASMNATVHDQVSEYPDIGGVYDLRTLQTLSQWGMEGSIETAVLTIQQSRDAPQFAGGFADFSLFYSPDDQSPRNIPFSGTVSGSVDCLGRIVVELRTDELPKKDYLWYGTGALESGQIVGKFSEGSGEGGTFTAVRR